MKHNDLLRAVARATGETVSRIRQMGFSLVTVPEPCQCMIPNLHPSHATDANGRLTWPRTRGAGTPARTR